MNPDPSERSARELLSARGVSGAVLEELLVYGAPLIPSGKSDAEISALPDELHLEAWTRYAAQARDEGAVAVLASLFPQFLFPIREGMSQSRSYRQATRQGISPLGDPEASGLMLRQPESITLEIASTLAGRVPLLIIPERDDFETLVRALSGRNEPVAVPHSMGACIVTGLNNWDRVRSYREAWENSHPSESWNDEFRRLVPQRDLYEDRLILLSTSLYSGVGAAEAGFSEERWRELSLSIRRHHESTHYFTLRVLGAVRNNFTDEIIADYVGLVLTFGRYRSDLAALFLGLEGYPAYREGARLQNYRGSPPLSDQAFAVARELVYEVVHNLARFDASCPEAMRDGQGLAQLVVTLMAMRLEELARVDLAEHVRSASHEPVPPLGPGRQVRAKLRIPCARSGIDSAMSVLSGFAVENALASRVSADLHVALDEVLSNIVKYGRNGENPEPIDLEFRLNGSFLEIEAIDSGSEFNPLGQPDPDLSQPLEDKPIGGLGVYLARRLTDEQVYERRDGKNRLLIRKRL